MLRAGWGVVLRRLLAGLFHRTLPLNTFNPGPAYNGIGHFSNSVGLGSLHHSGRWFAHLHQLQPNHRRLDGRPKLRTPYVQNFNLNVQQELGGHAALQVAYVGSQGRKLFRFRDLNQPDITQNPVVFPYPNFNIINNFESTATSNYNALQVSAHFRNLHGLSSQVNYTWSHAIDTASDGEDYVPNAAEPDNSLNPAAEKANSNYDSRNRFTWDFTYDLPGGHSKSKLTSGWSLNGLLRLSSGQPYNLNSFEDFNGSNQFFERPDVVGDPFASTHTPDSILNLSAFAAPCNWDPVAQSCDAANPGYHFGDLRRNAFVGPSFHNFDFSLVKATKLTERVNMQLRVDFFNVFNHPNFSNPLLPNFDVDLETNGSVASDPSTPGCDPAAPNSFDVPWRRPGISADYGHARQRNRQPVPGRGRTAQHPIGGQIYLLSGQISHLIGALGEGNRPSKPSCFGPDPSEKILTLGPVLRGAMPPLRRYSPLLRYLHPGAALPKLTANGPGKGIVHVAPFNVQNCAF